MAEVVTETVSGFLRFQLIQVGLENRLFEVIEETTAKTTKQIANEAECDERYVEEWCQVILFELQILKIKKISRTV